IGGGGNVVPITVNVPTTYTYDMRIWIDWNNDLDFNDAGELVAGGGLDESSGFAPWVTSFTVPAMQPAGNYRMRIGGADFGITGPCYAGSWRAFVDFTVSVCASPTDDGTVVVDDCVAQEFEVSVTVDLAGASSANVVYSVNGVAQPPVAYTPGVLVGPFAPHLSVDVSVVTNQGCSVDLGTFNSACDIELDCDAPTPIQMVHCYDNGDTRTWTWVNTEVGGTVALKFNSGSMETNDNIFFWEGAVGITAATPSQLTGTLDGQIVNSVGQVLSMSIVSDGSNSCADGGVGLGSGWSFQARCGGCVEPSGFVTADPNELGEPEVNCGVEPPTFNAYVGIADNGIDGNTGLPPATVGYRLFVNNVAQPDVTGLPGGEYYLLGSFPLTTDLDVVLLHEDQTTQSSCNVQVATNFTVGYNACPPANDVCANATVLTVNTLANCPANAVTGTTRGADQSGAQPSCATGPVQDVWYAVDITGWATPRLTITDGTATVVGVQLYNDCLTPQGYCTTDLTQFTFLNLNGLTPGVYYVRVFTTVAGAGNFNICVSSPGPAGYECDAAINIPSVPVTNQSVVCTGVAVPGLLNATTVPVACGGASNSYKGGEDALYVFTPTVTGDYTISYNGVTWSSIFVYSGACPTNGGVCVNSVGSSAATESLVVPMTAGVPYYIWFDTWPTPNSPCPGTFSISAPVVPCAGTPAPGNTISSPALVCSGSPVQLSLQNNVSGVGISYAWEFSTDGGLNWTPIGGNTPTLSTTITVATEFRANVTCANSMETGTSVPVLVGIETNPV
ncbi:MAG TPA: GEVED domain-containing protein, partial [Flavobacteriales bacterium]|nr:GEVED domain-containing protein [Flavobacteriales bacterium]